MLEDDALETSRGTDRTERQGTPPKVSRFGWFFQNPINELLIGLATVGVWFSAGLALYGLYLIGAQAVGWLKWDYWAALPATSLFLGSTTHQEQQWLGWLLEPRGTFELGTFASWVVYPQSWHGVHRLVTGSLELLSVPVVFLGLAACLFMLSSAIIERLDRPTSSGPGHHHDTPTS